MQGRSGCGHLRHLGRRGGKFEHVAEQAGFAFDGSELELDPFAAAPVGSTVDDILSQNHRLPKTNFVQ